jgi:hypothetical protein
MAAVAVLRAVKQVQVVLQMFLQAAVQLTGQRRQQLQQMT